MIIQTLPTIDCMTSSCSPLHKILHPSLLPGIISPQNFLQLGARLNTVFRRLFIQCSVSWLIVVSHRFVSFLCPRSSAQRDPNEMAVNRNIRTLCTKTTRLGLAQLLSTHHKSCAHLLRKQASRWTVVNRCRLLSRGSFHPGCLRDTCAWNMNMRINALVVQY